MIPLEELKRPRVDVVVNCSGVFRDLFVNQMNLLDRAVKLAAEQDEPDDMNFVRKHAREQVCHKTLGAPLTWGSSLRTPGLHGLPSSAMSVANHQWQREKFPTRWRRFDANRHAQSRQARLRAGACRGALSSAGMRKPVMSP